MNRLQILYYDRLNIKLVAYNSTCMFKHWTICKWDFSVQRIWILIGRLCESVDNTFSFFIFCMYITPTFFMGRFEWVRNLTDFSFHRTNPQKSHGTIGLGTRGNLTAEHSSLSCHRVNSLEIVTTNGKKKIMKNHRKMN